MPLTGPQIAATLAELGVTHVVWVPDSHLGTWETAILATPGVRLLRVSREGEAWALAAGLHLGGARPLVIMQCTGLFESGDALRNVVHDLGLPIYGIIGYRSYLLPNSTDSAKRFAEPILQAWQIDYTLVDRPEGASQLVEHYRACQAAGRAGVTLIAEGRG